MSRTLLAALLLVACRRDDYEVKVLPAGAAAPAGWSTLGYDELDSAGKCAQGPGRVAFRRPPYTGNEAILTCYEDADGHAIAVSLKFPDEAWSRAGWKPCTPTQAAAMDAACKH